MLAKRIFFLISLCCVGTLFAAPLKPNPEIVQGVLPNGVRYLIQPNQQPANKLELRLVMEAGSNGETDQQLGYAHFVEHMAFQHTKHFQKETVGQFIESLGMRIGPDSNAYTSFNETVFMLPVPTKDEAKLKKAVTLLADWVGGIVFRPADALKESRVITEEWRLSEHQRAQMRPAEDVVQDGSRYLERSPIGDMKQVGLADVRQLEDFYRREYRPERATIVAVGDIDPQRLLALLKAAFPATGKAAVVPPVVPPLTLEKLPATVVMSHDSLQEPLLKWLIPSRVIPVDSEASMEEGLAIVLAQNMFLRRLQLQSEVASYPISKSWLDTDEMQDRRDATTLLISPRNGQIEAAWSRLLQEVQRVRANGFTVDEYTGEKDNLLNSFRQMDLQAHAGESSDMAGSLVHDVLQGNVPMAAKDTLQQAEKWLKTDRLPDVNRAFVRMMDTPQKLLVAMLPVSMPLVSVSKSKLETIAASAGSLPALPLWVEKEAGSLLKQNVQAGQIQAQNALPDGSVDYVLSNGIHVRVKRTDNKPGEVLIRGFSAGGAYPLPAADYLAATMVDNVLNRSGVGDYSLAALDKMLGGKQVSSFYWVGAIDQGISGKSRSNDLEELLAYVHLQLSQPRVDNLVMDESKKEQANAWLKSRQQTMNLLLDDLSDKIWNNDYRKQNPGPDQIQQVSSADISRLAKQMFVSSGPWSFVIVGDVPLARLDKLLPKWLGSLPANHQPLSPVLLTPSGSYTDIRSNSAELQKFDATNRSQTYLLARVPATATQPERMLASVLEDILQQRLESVLRQQLGLVYGVDVDAEVRRTEGFRLDVAFSSKSESAAIALQKTREMLKDICAQGVTAEEFQAAIQHKQRVLQDAEKDDASIVAGMETALRYGEQPLSIPERIRQLAGFRLEEVNRVAHQWLAPEHLSVAQVNPYKEPS